MFIVPILLIELAGSWPGVTKRCDCIVRVPEISRLGKQTLQKVSKDTPKNGDQAKVRVK